jgi:amino acid transporter
VVVVSTASIARGSVGYIQVFLSWPDPAIAGGLVLLFTAVACLGVRESVGLAAAMTAVEIGGLLLVVAAGGPALRALPQRIGELLPALDPGALAGVAVGALPRLLRLQSASRTWPTWRGGAPSRAQHCRAPS